MRIACVGGGPTGLYLALLAKKRRPGDTVTVYERNPPVTTHGWAVVFSEDFVDQLHDADPASGRLLRDAASICGDQQVRLGDRPAVHLGGLYGYSMDRHRMLAVLSELAAEAGVEVRHGQAVDDVAALDADLVVATDGAGSPIRTAREEAFGTTVRAGRNRYAWLGTDRKVPGFTFAFERTDAGWVWAYAYPSTGETSTFIVECSPATWTGLGLDTLEPEQGVRMLERVFAGHLDGFPLKLPALGQGRSPWLQFREVRNDRWYDGNVVLAGDAAHTTHFSIGSGTVLALGDAIALADVLATPSGADPDLPAALAAYERRRKAEMESRRRAAAVSMQWFEDVEQRLEGQDPVRFAYALFNRQGDQPTWRYPLHVLTQNPLLRRGRRVLTTARQNRREARRT